MGFYIDGPTKGKASHILNNWGGIRFELIRKFEDTPINMVPVVVVNNGSFEAAGICFNEREYKGFTNPYDPRPREGIYVPRKKIIELYPYLEHGLETPEEE